MTESSVRPMALTVLMVLVVHAVDGRAASLSWTGCDADTMVASAAAIDCGWLDTGEVWSGRPVRLRVVVLRARPDRNDREPVVHIPGGPGAAAGLDARSLRRWRVWQQRAGWPHDIVLFDPRGTGQSRPRASCKAIIASRRTTTPKDSDRKDEFAKEARAARRCYRALGAKRAAALGPEAQLRDLRALVVALNVTRVNLWAVSYGTRIARLFAERARRHVRAVVLDSLFPFERNDLSVLPDQIGGAVAALDRYCAKRSECRSKGRAPSETVHGLLTRYDARAPTLSVAYDGRLRAMAISPYRLLRMILFASYDADNRAETIARLRRARRGEIAALAPLAAGLLRRDIDASRSEAVFWSTRCAFGKARPSRARWQAALAAYPMLAPYLESARDAPVCDFWQVPMIALPGRRAALESPTLVVTGDEDIVTPASWAVEFVAAHPRARLLHVPTTGHVASFSSACALEVIAAFWRMPRRPIAPGCVTDS